MDFEELCERTYERVAKAAFLILGDLDESRDVAQEALVRAYERWPQVRAMENPEGWVYRVAMNLSLNGKRRASRHPLGGVPDEAGRGNDPPDPILAAALARLTASQRAAIVLRFYLDLSIDSTADALRVRPGTVRALTAQGVARLRKDLGPEYMIEDLDERPLP